MDEKWTFGGESPGAESEDSLSPLPHLAAAFRPRISAGSLAHGQGTGCGHNPWDEACCDPRAGSPFAAITRLCARAPVLLRRSGDLPPAHVSGSVLPSCHRNLG